MGGIRSAVFVSLLFAWGCGRLGFETPGTDAASSLDVGVDTGVVDAGLVDADPPDMSRPPTDSGSGDAPADVGAPDGGVMRTDVGPDDLGADAGPPVDAGDTGVDAGSPFVIETVATGMTGAGALAADDTFVYWFGRGQIWRVSRNGGTPTSLFMTGLSPDSIAVDGTHLYWQDYTGHFIVRGPKTGGIPEPIAFSMGSPQEVVVDATHIYWPTDGAPASALERVTLTGGMGVPLQLVQSGLPDHVAIDDTYVYWVSGNGDANINRINKTTFAADVLLMVGGFRDLTVQGSELYFATPTSVHSMPSSGGLPITLSNAERNIGHISVGDSYVAWTNFAGDGDVRRAPKGGGAIEVVAPQQDRPTSLLADGNTVYWTVRDTVYRVVF